MYGLTVAGARWLNDRDVHAIASVRRVVDMSNPEHALWMNFIVLGAEARELRAMTENPNEVINVCGSIQAARSTGIEHVVFISDACRSLPSEMKTASLGSGLVFPFAEYRSPQPEVDVFYATVPGDVALEVPPDATSPRNRGLLTQYLLDALDGRVPDVIRSQQHAGGTSRVVPCRPLKAWLTSAIPNAASAIQIRLQQYPDIRIESDPSRYLSKLPQEADASASPPMQQPVVLQDSPPVPGGRQRMRLVPSRASSRPVSSPASLGWHKARPAAIARSLSDHEIREFESGQAAIDFAETRSGIVVQGGKVHTAMSSTGPISPLRAAAPSWGYFPPVDPEAPHAVQTIALRFSSGDGVVLPLIPGYIAAVGMSGAGIASVRYRMTQTTRNQYSGTTHWDEVERVRAKLVAMVRNGLLSATDVQEIDEKTLTELIEADPMMAIYTSYAYGRSGRFDRIEALAGKVAKHLGFVPFDIALLAGQRGDSRLPTVSPGMPVLTQGWLMMGRFELQLPEPLRVARQFLRNSLWATFNNDGMTVLERHLFGG